MHVFSTGLPWFSSLQLQGVPVLTEAEVQRSFRKIFNGAEAGPDDFDNGEALLDELRPESPLRHRLSVELEELRKICESNA